MKGLGRGGGNRPYYIKQWHFIMETKRHGDVWMHGVPETMAQCPVQLFIILAWSDVVI